MKTPASSLSRMTGYAPPRTRGASSKSTARCATTRNWGSKSCTLDRLVQAHGAGQLVGPRDHLGQLVQRRERRDAPAAARVEDADEPALILTHRRGFETPAAKGDGGAPGAFDANLGVIGAGLLEALGYTIFQLGSFSLAR